MPTSTIPRINAAELGEEYTDNGSPIVVWQGHPFTGVAFEVSPQGTLWSEQTYDDGALGGISKDWHLNGQLRSQTGYKWNRVHGHDQEWYINGQIKYDNLYELGILLHERQWDEQGRLTKSYDIEQDPAQQQKLSSQREFFQLRGLV